MNFQLLKKRKSYSRMLENKIIYREIFWCQSERILTALWRIILKKLPTFLHAPDLLLSLSSWTHSTITTQKKGKTYISSHLSETSRKDYVAWQWLRKYFRGSNDSVIVVGEIRSRKALSFQNKRFNWIKYFSVISQHVDM